MSPAAARAETDAGALPAVSWALRAAQVRAVPADADAGIEALLQLWRGGRLAGVLDAAPLARLRDRIAFARVGPGQRLIGQDEGGDFMLVVIEGRIAIERIPTVGATARFGEARPGDVVGDMALLDDGPRFSTCTTKTDCVVAVIEADALAALLQEDRELALVLLAALARRLSLRVRQIGARLSALLADG
jgi:CRP-like cAMP-binding protein